MQGINWFGFNNGQTMVDGLWAGYQNASLGDFPTVLKRIKLLGFNGLRLPFTFTDLDKAPTSALYVPGVKVSQALVVLPAGQPHSHRVSRRNFSMCGCHSQAVFAQVRLCYR
jgi:hypothetical protein